MRRGSPKLHIMIRVNATSIVMSGGSLILELMLLIALK